jgi:hypothetical protein
MFSSSKVISFILGVALLCIFVAQGYWLARGFPKVEPLEVFSAVAVNKEVPLGSDHIDVQFTVQRRRLCAVDTDRFLINADSSTVVFRERVFGVAASVLNQRATITAVVPIPKDLPPGMYIFRGFIFSNCGMNDFHGIQQPDVYFSILDKAL